MEQAGINIRGLLINACEIEKSSFRYRYGYGYGYSYGDYPEKKPLRKLKLGAK
ncbi:MAG: hypothetical protein ACM3S2_02755 [Ignavibacteriales bacterium]